MLFQICIRHWEFNYPDLEDLDQCKTKERDYYNVTDANFDGKNTEESVFSLVTAK